LEEKTISARHARLYYEMAQWWAEDLHSTNGTFLNDELIASPMVLTSGDHLRCGEAIFEISIIPSGSTAEIQKSSSTQSINDKPTSQSQSGG
jgi:pSer/pThr/pTyr-binding forkhead associated (FHA) protein